MIRLCRNNNNKNAFKKMFTEAERTIQLLVHTINQNKDMFFCELFRWGKSLIFSKPKSWEINFPKYVDERSEFQWANWACAGSEYWMDGIDINRRAKRQRVIHISSQQDRSRAHFKILRYKKDVQENFQVSLHSCQLVVDKCATHLLCCFFFF